MKAEGAQAQTYFALKELIDAKKENVMQQIDQASKSGKCRITFTDKDCHEFVWVTIANWLELEGYQVEKVYIAHQGCSDAMFHQLKVCWL